MSSIMSLDFGLSKIGIAVGNLNFKTANPLTIIKAKKGEPVWVELDMLVKDWLPDTFIVGLPLHMDGSESRMSNQASAFADKIMQRYKKEVILVDERLTSFVAKGDLMAEREMLRTKVPSMATRLKNKSCDDIAATILLEQWFASF